MAIPSIKIFFILAVLVILVNTGFCIYPYVKYLNYILIGVSIIGLIYIGKFYKEKSTKEENNNIESNGLLTDNEIFLENKIAPLKNIIEAHKSLSFFSMALIGKWGSGKSSYLKTLERDLNKEYEIVKINVWQLENSENITNEIKKEFDNILFKYDKVLWLTYLIKRLFIRDYFALLSKYITKTEIKFTFSFEPTIQNSQKEFDNLLSKILEKKKIILLIDELDRLESKDEILNVFKVIRYTAFFKSVFAITAFDIKQIENKLDDIDYIHKIFNLKYLVPNIDKDELITYIEEHIVPEFEEFSIKKEELNILDVDLSKNRIIEAFSNYREVKNVFNDTYTFIEYLEKDSKDWNEYISFKFIFSFNLIKAVNFELYSQLLFDKQFFKIIEKYKDRKKYEDDKKLRELLDKIEKAKLEKILYFYCQRNNIQYFDIYLQHKIYNYHVSQTKYDNYIKNINKLEEDFNEINYNKEENREKFILNVLDKNKQDKKNHLLILKKVVQLMPKDNIFSYRESSILKKIATDTFVTDDTEDVFIELLKLKEEIPFVFMRYLLKHLSESEKKINYALIEKLLIKYFENLKIEDDKFNEHINNLIFQKEFPKENNIYKIYKIIYNHFKKTDKIKKALLHYAYIQNIKYLEDVLETTIDELIDDRSDYIIMVPIKYNQYHSEYFIGKELKEKIRHFVKLKKIKFASSSKLLTLRDFEYHRIEFCKKSIKELKEVDK